MTSYITARDGQRITARKIRETLEAIPAPEPKICLALRLLSDGFRYGTLDIYPSGTAGSYVGYAALTLSIYMKAEDIDGLDEKGTRYHFRKSKPFADALLWMADYGLDD